MQGCCSRPGSASRRSLGAGGLAAVVALACLAIGPPTAAAAAPDLAVSWDPTTVPSTALVEDIDYYTLNFANNGDADATNGPYITIDPPANGEIYQAEGVVSCYPLSGDVRTSWSCQLPSLAAGSSEPFTVTVHFSESGNASTVATATDQTPVGGESSDTLADNTATAQTEVIGDTDGDGVLDPDDDCPNVAGTPALNGCPDNDGDGIANADDDCPNLSGSPSANGCPDNDGDSVANAQDACRGVAGDTANGCPDIDRSLTLSFRRGAYKGQLSSPEPGCVRAKEVTVWKKVGPVGGDDDKKLGSDDTNSNGKYAVDHRKKRGKYYSSVSDETVAIAGNCLASMSPIMKIG